MKKFHIILIVLFGFLLMPINTFACGNSCGQNTEKQSCKKETSSQNGKDNYCDSGSHSKTKNHEGCGGKCSHSKCACPVATNGFAIPSEFIVKNNNFDFSFEKQKFSTIETSISSGYYSIWLLPKIS